MLISESLANYAPKVASNKEVSDPNGCFSTLKSISISCPNFTGVCSQKLHPRKL